MKTWHLETALVAAVLIAVNLATHCEPIAWVGALAVLLSFGHASVASRMEEKVTAPQSPAYVGCHRWLTRYLVGKEIAWVIYFLATRSYPALVGCGVFLVHPIWRRYYRRMRAAK